MKLPIYAPKGWWEIHEEHASTECNGCGSDKDISGILPLDTIYGLDVSEYACCPHDYMYEHGETYTDKLFADVMFLYNMVAIILNRGGWVMWLRLFRATKYFVAVVALGDTAYGDRSASSKDITYKGEFWYVEEN